MRRDPLDLTVNGMPHPVHCFREPNLSRWIRQCLPMRAAAEQPE